MGKLRNFFLIKIECKSMSIFEPLQPGQCIKHKNAVDLKMAKEEVKYQKSFQKMTSITKKKSQENNNVSPQRFQNLNPDSVMVNVECEDTLSVVEVGPSRSTSSPI